MNQSNRIRNKPVPSGFALVVTLSLMILLTVIAIGLLGLSAVTLRASSQGNATAEARANARLALMMAIGELQKELGPDSRITAPHDAGKTASGGKPHWTAVYEAWRRPSDPATPVIPGSRSPKFLGWLASGANQATGGPAGTGEDADLVGSESLARNTTAANRIRVPMLAVTRGTQKGRIAWWTADESVKAKINAGPDAGPGRPLAASSPLLDTQSPPHVGHKAIEALKNFDWKQGQRSTAVTNGGVGLAAELDNRGLGSVNHDITMHSAGVLSDVRTGRLKRDLTNLLSRPVAELENMPLYLAGGRVNEFLVSEDGKVSNAGQIPANGTGANRWGINLEELHLFHEIHREVDWSTGAPRLVNKNSKEEMARDRFFIYRRPKMEAMNVMLSLKAEPDTAPNTYRMAAMMDAMIATSNPNDIPVVWPASVQLRMDMEGFPYTFRWNIRRANNAVRHSHTVEVINRPFFQSAIRSGFTLKPGEAAVFGASSTDTQSRGVNLTRGYAPRGGVRINESEWDGGNANAQPGLRATGLALDDTIDFSMVTAPRNFGATPSGWISCFAKLRNSSSGTPATDILIGSHKLAGGGNSVLTTAPINIYLPSPIRPPQTLSLRDFITAQGSKSMPVMMITTMTNSEKSRTDFKPPNAFPSRPCILHEPAIRNMTVSTTTAANTYLTMQNSQLIVIAEPMDYEFGNDRTMPAGDGGGNLYHGGGRQVDSGGTSNVIKRRIPLVAPVSLGAFENAIACGMTQRFASPGTAFIGTSNALPAMAKSIGNSWTNPFISPGSIFEGEYHDPSWMANTALWDSWFLSGIVDGRGAGSNPFMNDSRSPREQFRELAEGTGKLRNKRFVYNRNESIEVAMNELFNGESLKPAAINKLPGYLLVDGAFNVNSTSASAWKAFLTSVRDQELLDPNGSSQKADHPFGTLGYAATAATSGTEGDWNGFRNLSDPEMETLANNIVEQVRARGPFLNMADFINRRPDSPDSTHKALGALQAAIDKSGLNGRYDDDERRLNPVDVPALAGRAALDAEEVPARAIGSAGFLSQAALLSSFGSQIAVRGDTFLVRTYGDARDTSGRILAKAWCEAVVQRMPGYVDSSNAPETAESLTPINRTFGRRFEIVSFRWLDSKEI